MNPNLLKGNLELILLLIIEEGPKYGLEIIKEAEVRTDGYFHFKEGSLYPALHRLTTRGYLMAQFQPSPRGVGVVKYYELTPAGRKALTTMRDEFRQFVDAVGSLHS